MPRQGNSFVLGSMWRVLFVLIAVALVPMVVIQAIIYAQWYHVRTDLAGQSNLEFAKTVAVGVHSIIDDIRHDQEILAASVTYLKPYTNDDLTRVLARAPGNNPAIRSFHLADARGIITASSDPKAIGLDVTVRDYWKKIAAGADWSTSDLLTGRATGLPTIFIATAIRGPARELEGIVFASVDPDAMGDLVVPGDRGNGGTVLLFDSKGMLLYRRPKRLDYRPDVYRNDPHLREALGGSVSSGPLTSPIDGRPLIVARVPVADIGWAAGAGVPVANLSAPIVRSLYLNIGILLVSTIVSLGVAGAVGYAIVRGVLRLRAHARAVGGGDLKHRADVGGVTELRDLAESFNEMAALLQERDETLGRRTRELEIANKELEAFSFSVSHDLRAPLRYITGFSQALIEDCAPKLNEQDRGYLDHIRKASQWMGTLIEAFLGLSRVARAEMKTADVDMTQIAERIAGDLQRGDPSRIARFTIQGGLIVRGDQSLITIVLDNLLGNAWKFTRGKPAAQIEFGRTSEGTRTAFFMRDNGAGFDMAYADRLFAPFQRLHSDEEFEGTGVGLATVKRIITRHGGEIWAKAVVNEGATFYFTIGA